MADFDQILNPKKTRSSDVTQPYTKVIKKSYRVDRKNLARGLLRDQIETLNDHIERLYDQIEELPEDAVDEKQNLMQIMREVKLKKTALRERYSQLINELLAINRVEEDEDVIRRNENIGYERNIFKRNDDELEALTELAMTGTLEKRDAARRELAAQRVRWREYEDANVGRVAPKNSTLDLLRTKALWNRADELATRLGETTGKVGDSVKKYRKDVQEEEKAVERMNKYIYHTEFNHIKQHQGRVRDPDANETPPAYLPHSSRTFKNGDEVLFRPIRTIEENRNNPPMGIIQRIPQNDVLSGRVVKILNDGPAPWLSYLTVRTANGEDFRTFAGLTVKAPRVESHPPFAYKDNPVYNTTSASQPEKPTQEEEMKKDKFFLEYLTSNANPAKTKLPIDLFQRIGDYMGLPAPSIGISKEYVKQRVENQNKVISQIRALPNPLPEQPVLMDVERRGRIREREGDEEERPARRARILEDEQLDDSAPENP